MSADFQVFNLDGGELGTGNGMTNYDAHDFTVYRKPEPSVEMVRQKDGSVKAEERKQYFIKCRSCDQPFLGTPDDVPTPDYPPCVSQNTVSRGGSK